MVVQSEKLASELVQKLPAAALAALIGTLSVSSADVARAAEFYTPPGGSGSTTEAVRQQAPQSVEFPAGSTAVAPAVKGGEYQLPEGNQWRYSEFINAVQSGKVERVRFSKEGGQLQACASCPAVPSPWPCMPPRALLYRTGGIKEPVSRQHARQSACFVEGSQALCMADCAYR